MAYSELVWRSADGAQLFGCEWKPADERRVRAVVCIAHGMGEHAGRYAHVAHMLVAEGYAVLAYDQRGHGRTSGRRGHTPSYEALLDDLGALLAEAKRRHPEAPLFLYGHSMGGNVALNYMLRRQLKLAGAIIAGPWLELAFEPEPLKVFVGRLMERIVPTYTSDRPGKVEHLTSDPEMARRIVSDPLGHYKITARFFFAVKRAGEWALAHAAELSVPTLIMHAGSDKVTSATASKRFAERAGAICQWVEWPGFNHELHNERGREDVFAYVRQWLDGKPR